MVPFSACLISLFFLSSLCLSVGSSTLLRSTDASINAAAAEKRLKHTGDVNRDEIYNNADALNDNKAPEASSYPMDLLKPTLRGTIDGQRNNLRRRVQEDDKQHHLHHKGNRSHPVFGIFMATNRRSEDPLLYLVGNTSLKSVASQTYHRWLFFIGCDAMSDEEMTLLQERITAAGLPRSRVHLVNIPFNESERAVYTGLRELWMFGGTAAANAASKLAYAHPSVTHLALMGDDDIIHPNHLATLTFGYHVAEDIGFVHTRGNWTHPKEKGPFPWTEVEGKYSIQAPKPCFMVATTASWSKQYFNNTFQRREEEQLKPGNRPRMPNSMCGNETSLPNDADLWDRIWTKIEVDHICRGVYVPKVTADYHSRDYKAQVLLPLLYPK